MEIRIGSEPSTCVIVAPESIEAGPFRTRDLLYAGCGSVEDKFKRWVVKR